MQTQQTTNATAQDSSESIFESGLTIIAAGCSIRGPIESEKGLSIFGLVEGNVYVPSAIVHIGLGGRVIGDIEADTVRCEGYVEGDIIARTHLQVFGKVRGELHYGTINLGVDADLDGCFMQSLRSSPSTKKPVLDSLSTDPTAGATQTQTADYAQGPIPPAQSVPVSPSTQNPAQGETAAANVSQFPSFQKAG